MDAYLTTLDNLKTNHFRDLTLVLGNESCDLDSAVCAVVYAAFLHWQYMQIKCKVCTRGSRDETAYRDDIFVPILNVDRQDFSLKTEVGYCLQEHGIDASKLVFRDDYDLEKLSSRGKTSVTLVDHHVLAARDQFLVKLVTEIIDHRPVDRSQWKYGQDTRSSIEQVGSCCSLVTQRIRDLGKLVSTEAEFFNAYPTATDLLHCGIILDTVNFSKEVNKATPVDEEMALFLEGIFKPTSHEDDRKSKLDRLVRARRDVSQLSGAQLLRKDVKIAGNVLVPSFPILIEDFFKIPGAYQAVVEVMSAQSCSLAVLLGMSLEGTLARDAAVLATNSGQASQLSKHLQQWSAPPLQLVPDELEAPAPGVLYFRQLNLAASRKQYMPALAQFTHKAKKP